MKKSSRRGWAHAVCVDCGWELDNVNAQAVGAKHAKDNKHKVLVTVEIECSYDGRNSNKSRMEEQC